MPSRDALDELIHLLGEAAVRTDAAEVAGYVVPWRGPAGDAGAVVRPSDTEQVRQVVAWARRHVVRLIPQGANTGLVGASTPPAGGDAVVLSMTRLRGTPVIDPRDRTATAGAGIRLSELNEAARPHGLSLPIDLAADPTLGGMVATNTGGARMLRHGDLRRSLLGLRAVLADEGCSVVDELTTLRKHNVGPSIAHLLVGSGGALGVITEVSVELQPLAADRATAWIVPSDDASIITALTVLESRFGDQLSAFEVVAEVPLRAACALDRVTAPFGDRPLPPHSVLVEFEGEPGAEARLVEALASLADAGLLDDATVLPSDAAWSVRHGVTEGLSRLGTVVGFDVAVPRPALPDLVTEVRRLVAQELPRAVVADFGHWGDGGVHCNLVFPDVDGVAAPPDDAERLRASELVLGTVVDRFGGSFGAEHGVGPANSAWWRHTTSEGTRATLRAAAVAVDPLGILGHPGLPYRDP